MALSFLRLRRVLTLSPSLIRNCHAPISLSCYRPISNVSQPYAFASQNPKSDGFRSHSTSSFLNKEEENISSNTLPSEGISSNNFPSTKKGDRWFINMKFSDPTLNPELKREAYLSTAAQVFGSIEEANERIYSWSTTDYDGFSVFCTEELSSKFRGLPGVLYVLPEEDDLVNDYGGNDETQSPTETHQQAYPGQRHVTEGLSHGQGHIRYRRCTQRTASDFRDRGRRYSSYMPNRQQRGAAVRGLKSFITHRG